MDTCNQFVAGSSPAAGATAYNEKSPKGDFSVFSYSGGERHMRVFRQDSKRLPDIFYENIDNLHRSHRERDSCHLNLRHRWYTIVEYAKEKR